MDGFVIEKGSFASEDLTQLSYWYFSYLENKKNKNWHTAYNKPRGLVIQFHGNAENMTSHYRNLVWFIKEGYDFVTFDYRGYGSSSGESDVEGICEDTKAALKWAFQRSQKENLPLIVYGQSLGGSLLLKALQDPDLGVKPSLVVVESAFYSYRQIAKEKLALHWLTWPLQPLTYLLIVDKYSPGGPGLKNLPPAPVVLIYSKNDPIVPFHHGEQIFSDLVEPKYLWSYDEPGHTVGTWVQDGKFRKQLISLIKN